MKIVTENRSKNADTNREIVFHEIYPSQEREREKEREKSIVAAHESKIYNAQRETSSPLAGRFARFSLPSAGVTRRDASGRAGARESHGWNREAKGKGTTRNGVSSARGKAWSGDARRPFVSCASRTRNALASHGHRSRLPLTSRIVPRLCTLYPHLTLLRVRIYARVVRVH